MSENTKVRFVRSYGAIEEVPEYRVYWLTRLVYSTGFELFIGFVILTNAFALAVLTMPDITLSTREMAYSLDQVCFAIYGLELIIRILSYGKKPWKFFQRGWNIFDFLIIAASPFFQGQLVVARLLRLLRLVRIFRFLPEVRILSTSIIKSMPPLLSMSVLIALLLFLYGMAGHYLFAQGAPQSWGNITTSMKTLFILLTLENFPIYLEEALETNPFALPFFLSYVFIIVFTVLNVLIGIVLHAMDQARDEHSKSRKEVRELEKLSLQVTEIVSDGKVSKDEIEKLRAELIRIRNAAIRN